MKKVIAFSIVLTLLAFECQSWRRWTESNTVHADETAKWTKVEIPLSIFHRETKGYGYAGVEGFWQSTSPGKDKQLVFPIQIRIKCTRPEKMCREANAAIVFGVLKADILEYEISSWTEDAIVADDTDEGDCGIGHRLSLDFRSNSVTVTDYPKKVVNNKNCRPFQEANSYALHGGNLVLYPPATWDPLAKPEGKK